MIYHSYKYLKSFADKIWYCSRVDYFNSQKYLDSNFSHPWAFRLILFLVMMVSPQEPTPRTCAQRQGSPLILSQQVIFCHISSEQVSLKEPTPCTCVERPGTLLILSQRVISCHISSHEGKSTGAQTPYLCPEARVTIDPVTAGYILSYI